MMELKAPRGTEDILPGRVAAWQYLEGMVRGIFGTYGYGEIRTPVFEQTDLFQRGIGETTDIVEKEMYTFADRGGRSVTLRPEGTAPVVRAFLEHKLYSGALPFKVYYIGPMFRYERPQAGRYRQFHQVGAEAIGSDDPLLDVEMMAMPIHLYTALGLGNFQVRLNSIGCQACRPIYRERLRRYFGQRLSTLCASCVSRYERNPMRILDCKQERCRQVTVHAPPVTDDLCGACREHFETVQRYMQVAGLSYVLDPRLVRGFDYYTKTVFEITSPDLGAQDALGGGGRYDGLVSEIGGPIQPAVGFAIGVERLLIALEQQGIALPQPKPVQVFVANVGDGSRNEAIKALLALRRVGISAEADYTKRGLRGQMKAADRSGAGMVLIFGEDESKRGVVLIRDLASGVQEEIGIENLVSEIVQRLGS